MSRLTTKQRSELAARRLRDRTPLERRVGVLESRLQMLAAVVVHLQDGVNRLGSQVAPVEFFVKDVREAVRRMDQGAAR